MFLLSLNVALVRYVPFLMLSNPTLGVSENLFSPVESTADDDVSVPLDVLFPCWDDVYVYV